MRSLLRKDSAPALPLTTSCNTWSRNPTTKWLKALKILGKTRFSKFREMGGSAKFLGGTYDR